MAGYLITPEGTRLSVGSMQHNIYCRQAFKLSLKTFLARGGVRIKVFRDHVAIESGTLLNERQRMMVIGVLRQDDYYFLVVCIGGKWADRSTWRPIRSL